MNTWHLVLQFVFSGAIVVGATLLSESIDSKWSGLLVALPIMTILGFVFISMNTTPVITQRYLLSALLFVIPAVVYLISVYLLLGKVSLAPNLLLSILPFGIAVFFVQKLL